MPEVIYIMGTGRSGTTILEILLANNPGIFGVGELTHIFKDGFVNDGRCSCGRKTSSCTLWKSVFEKYGLNSPDVSSTARLLPKVESHSRFPLLLTNCLRAELLLQYSKINKKLFESVAEITDAQVIVDSSKYAGRALALSRLYGRRVKIICLTRSPYGIMGSFLKTDIGEQKYKSPIAVMLYYFYVMSCMRAVTLKAKAQILHLKYEDVLSSPIASLEKIEQWSGYDLSSVRRELVNGESLAVGHIVTGNRLRNQGKVYFTPDAALVQVNGIGARIAVPLMDLYERVLRI